LRRTRTGRIALLDVISGAASEHLSLWSQENAAKEVLNSVAIAVQKGNAMTILGAQAAAYLRASDAGGSSSESTSSDASNHSSDSPSPRVLAASSAAAASNTATAAFAASTGAAATPDAARRFDPDECQPTRWPIFRSRHVVARPPAANKTQAELAELTFAQWLDYYLAHPSFVKKRKYLLSDEHYCLLLDFVTSKLDSIAEFVRKRRLDDRQQSWLYHHTGDNTYQYSMAEYKGASVAELDKGPVLVTFKEPARKKGAKRVRRKPGSTTAMTQGLLCICVPYSYIERVVHYCHTGGLASSMHTEQLMTWGKLNEAYHGINRAIVRMFVKKCATCQQRPQRVHKAALVPITARSLFERVVIDLIDFSSRPSHGYRYNLHAVDHFSKFHWAWAIQDKRAATVAYHLNCLLADTGPIQHVQCDKARSSSARC
jgi:hypothetical protein